MNKIIILAVFALLSLGLAQADLRSDLLANTYNVDTVYVDVNSLNPSYAKLEDIGQPWCPGYYPDPSCWPKDSQLVIRNGSGKKPPVVAYVFNSYTATNATQEVYARWETETVSSVCTVVQVSSTMIEWKCKKNNNPTILFHATFVL